MQHSRHYFRAGFLIGGLLLLFFLGRSFLIPPSFGKYGFYRADNVQEQRAKTPRFGPPESCQDCHSEVWEDKEKGKHQGVPCQDCHGPLGEHIDMKSGEFLEKMPVRRTSKLCLRCHLKLPSRPEAFPQIDLEDHLANVPDHTQPEICLKCHSPHNPLKKKWRRRP